MTRLPEKLPLKFKHAVGKKKKPAETTATNNYAETSSTEVTEHADFFVNYVKKTVRIGNIFLSATILQRAL